MLTPTNLFTAVFTAVVLSGVAVAPADETHDEVENMKIEDVPTAVRTVIVRMVGEAKLHELTREWQHG